MKLNSKSLLRHSFFMLSYLFTIELLGLLVYFTYIPYTTVFSDGRGWLFLRSRRPWVQAVGS